MLMEPVPQNTCLCDRSRSRVFWPHISDRIGVVPHRIYVSILNDLGLRSVFRGWPTFTPDGRFIIGPSAHVPGFVMAGGCNAHGVSGSAGIGRHVVESMFEEASSDYVRSLSPDRFNGGEWDWQTARRDAQACYETYYCLGH